MIKVVLFDFGGVLTEGGKLGSIRAMFAQAYGVRPQDVRLDGSVQDAFRGTISDDQFVEAINRLNRSYPPVTTALFADNADIFVGCEMVYAMARALRDMGVRTGIFSNVFAHSAALLKKKGFYEGFDPLFLSCEHGMLKPERPFYEYVMRQLGLRPAEILFIDDKDEFLAPAREFGMQTVLAVSPQQIVADTIALLVQQNGLEV